VSTVSVQDEYQGIGRIRLGCIHRRIWRWSSDRLAQILLHPRRTPGSRHRCREGACRTRASGSRVRRASAAREELSYNHADRCGQSKKLILAAVASSPSGCSLLIRSAEWRLLCELLFRYIIPSLTSTKAKSERVYLLT
jgi:hypothetical protein